MRLRPETDNGSDEGRGITPVDTPIPGQYHGDGWRWWVVTKGQIVDGRRGRYSTVDDEIGVHSLSVLDDRTPRPRVHPDHEDTPPSVSFK